MFFSESGIGLESGVFVATLAPGSPAARDCTLTIGDRLLTVSVLQEVMILTFALHVLVFFVGTISPTQLINFDTAHTWLPVWPGN